MIQLTDFRKAVKAPEKPRVLFANLNLTVSAPEFLCIVGPNGIGKSVLLNCILGLDKHFEGNVKVSTKRIGYVPQRHRVSLFPWLTVAENIAYPVRYAQSLNGTAERRIEELIGLLPPTIRPESWITPLSGGEAQVVALLRSLASSPELLVLDEPFSHMDLVRKEDLYRVLQDRVLRENITVMMITHDLEECLLLGTRVLVLGGGDGASICADLAVSIPRPRDGAHAASAEFNEHRRALRKAWEECCV